jgi:aconitate hydratase
VLTITEMLRKAKVVGKFVEFHGAGAARLNLTDRATIGNMAPEYGATMGFFPVDEESCRYLLATGRTRRRSTRSGPYFQAQGMFGMPAAGQITYSQLMELDLSTVRPSVAGPKRPQDRIDCPTSRRSSANCLQSPQPKAATTSAGRLNKRFTILTGINQAKTEDLTSPAAARRTGNQPLDAGRTGRLADRTGHGHDHRDRDDAEPPTPDRVDPDDARAPRVSGGTGRLRHGDVVIAAITSCTNTSNPSVMLAAGLLAKKAVERA